MAELEQIGINNLEAGQEACNQLVNAYQRLEVTRSTASSSFGVLKTVNPDLGSQFITELNSSLDDIYKFLKENLYPSAEAYFKENTQIGPPEITTGGTDGVGGGVPPTSTDTAVTPPDTTEQDGGQETEVVESEIDDGGSEEKIEDISNDEPEETEEVVPSVVEAVQLEEIDTSSLEEMSLDDVDNMIDEMVDLAEQKNQKLDQLVEDDENSDSIKETLLASPYVPDAFKEIIAELDSSVVRLLLDYILKGNSPEVFDLNTLNLGIVYSILEETAKENDILISELINNPKYTDLLREKLSSFDNVIELISGWEELSNEDFQVQLRSFYYGEVSEEFPDEDILITRAYVDYLAEACDVYYEDLLKDQSYAETLKEGAIQFGKALTFFKATSFFTDEGLRNNVVNMFNGSNYKAFGMTEENVDSFRSEIDSLAQANNTTTEKLLSDSQYSDLVKDALMSSDSAKGVGMIYKDADSSVSQEVAKNLYNVSFEESEQQKELNELVQKAQEAAQQAADTSEETTNNTSTEESTTSGEEK